MTNEIKSNFITIKNETGIHARPASHLFQIANKYKSTIQFKKGEKIINAKSIIAILGLGVKFGEQIQIIANGDDAQEAINSLIAEINAGMGEQPHQAGNNTNTKEIKIPQPLANNLVKDFSSEVSLNGIVASPGLVIGNSYLFADEEIDIVENSNDSTTQLKLFETSLASLKNKITQDIEIAKVDKHKAKVEIFQAHLKILDDNTLIEDTKEIINKGKSAGFAWKQVIINSIGILNATGDTLLIERTADLKDLQKRLLKLIVGIKEDDTDKKFAPNTIILAKDLVPSDIVKVDDNVVGVVLAFGSSTAHIALMLRNMGTPTLVVVGESILHIKNNTKIVLNANDSMIIVNPSKEKLVEISKKQDELNKIKEINIKNAKLEAKTLDGRVIKVKGNVSNPGEAKKAFELGAQGLGLFRTEFLFFNSQQPLTLQEQHKIYQDALDNMQGETVTFRTLDVGGDKPLPYIKIGQEENPILGLRGVRNYSLNMEILTTQIHALLKLKPLFLVKIMIPMVSEISEMIQIHKIIEAEKKKLGITEKISIGTMIEVPSAAVLADQFSKYVEFFSIGTNDLAQYTLAMDRGNPNLTGRLKNLNPALLRLIKMTVDGGNPNNVPTAICGAMASEINAIPILIGLGIQELSPSMKSIPDVKALIRSLNYEKCKEVANLALQMESPEQVIELVNKEFKL